MGQTVGFAYTAILMGVVLLVYAAVAGKGGAILAGAVLIVLGAVGVALARRVED